MMAETNWDTLRKIVRDLFVAGLAIAVLYSPESVKAFAKRAGIDQFGSNGVHFREEKAETAALADKTTALQTKLQQAVATLANVSTVPDQQPALRALAGTLNSVKGEADAVTAALRDRLAEQDQQLRRQGEAPSSDGWLYVGEIATEDAAEWERTTTPNLDVATPRALTTQTYTVRRNVFVRRDIGPPTDKDQIVGWRARQPIKTALKPGTTIRVERVERLPAADGNVAVWALISVEGV